MRVSVLLIITAAIVGVVSMQASVRGQGQEQENAASKEGPMLLERMCLSCHSIGDFEGLGYDKARWTTVVDDMLVRGATGTDREIQTLIDFLVSEYGPKAEPAHQ
jgi:hypothetical protein